jgi:uncharacterized membrane protein HdeD (DUF308 family)
MLCSADLTPVGARWGMTFGRLSVAGGAAKMAHARHCKPISVMPANTAQLVFSVLGPLFLLIGAVRCLAARRLVPQGRVWLIVGSIFSLVAVWLWWSSPAA